MRNAWFEEEVHILQICHDYIFLLHGIRKYCLVDYCMDSLFVCEFFIIVRGCVKKNSYTPILPLKKGSPVSLYIPSLVLSHNIFPRPLKKNKACRGSIVSSYWDYIHHPPSSHPTPLTTTQNKRICSEVLVVSLIYWVMCTLYEMVDQPITKN